MDAPRTLAGYTERPPPRELAEVVESVWSYLAPGPQAPPPHRVLPNPALSLCFECRVDGEIGPGKGWEPLAPRVLINGPVHHVRTFAPPGAYRLIAVQLRAEWCRTGLGLDPAEHVDTIDPFRLTHPGAAARVRARAVLAAREGGSVTRTLLEWIAERVARGAEVRAPRLAQRGLARLLARGPEGPQVHTVARDLGVTERHLRRVIRRETGAAPKFLQRIHRVTRLMWAADRAEAPRWARLAGAHGFYDQAHLIRELADLARARPGTLHAERRSEQVRFIQSRAARA